MNINLSSHNFLNDTKASREFYWPLTQRGFFSEILIFTLVLYYGLTENKKVNLLVSKKSILPLSLLKEFISYPFTHSVSRLSCLDVFASSKKGKILQVINYRLKRNSILPSHLFRQLWLEDVLGLKDCWDQEILTVFSNILNDLILIPGQSADIVMDLPFSNSLLDGYVCIHIRRGDKLISEAEDVGELEYLARIPARFASLPVVVITDDYNAYSRLAQAMRSRDSCRMVYTTASMDARGYDNEVHYRSTDLQRRKQLYHLLADFSLATKSSFFVGSYSSNVGRAVYISRKGLDIESIDGDFRFIW